MKGYTEIERRLDSLRMRTNLSIGLKNETWRFSRRNSRYVSHRGCVLESGHGIPRLINFCDGLLFVTPCGVTIKGKAIARDLPAFHFHNIFTFPATPPEWLGKGIVQVFYPDRFSGYGEDGLPLFEGNPEISVVLWDGTEYRLAGGG